MKNKLMSILLMLVFLLPSAGCNYDRSYFQKYTNPVEIPDADFVFSTIVSEKEVLGFYSFATGKAEIVNFGEFVHPIQPYYLNADTIMYKNKHDNFGNLNNNFWGLILSKGDHYYECDDKKISGSVYARDGQIVLSNSEGLFLVTPDDCSIEKTILSAQDLESIGENYYLPPSAYSDKEGFVIYNDFNSEVYRGVYLKKYLITQNKTIDLEKVGFAPVLSPDQKEITYWSYDGIHIMNTNGGNDELIVAQDEPYGFINGNAFISLPMWSPDSKKLLYHKCIGELTCSEISDYDIFVYDLDTKTETLLVKGGMYPAWNYYK
jgi:hypothetical protein